MKKLYEIDFQILQHWSVDIVAESEEEAFTMLEEAHEAGKARFMGKSRPIVQEISVIEERE